MSKIEWTERTWNPVTGCTKVSAGCKHCYAERMAKRLRAMGQHKYRNGFRVTCHPETLDEPRRWRKPRMVFVCSMGDLLHDAVPMSFILRVFGVMGTTPQHTYQVLTKRADRLPLLVCALDAVCGLRWPPNVWVGVTVENRDALWRINYLRRMPAPVRFLSCEPLLEDLGDLRLGGMDDLRRVEWVIVGGESGPGARPMDPAWARSIRDQCQEANVPFFFKQWGGVNKKAAGRELDGRTWDEMPEVTK